jgi:hypothetical protein
MRQSGDRSIPTFRRGSCQISTKLNCAVSRSDLNDSPSYRLGDSEDHRAFVCVGRNLNHPRAPARGILQEAFVLIAVEANHENPVT